MMGLSVAPTPAAISDALSLVNAMLDPQQAKRALEELQAQTAAAEKAKADAAAAQARVDADRAVADRLKAELDAQGQDLASREQKHNAAGGSPIYNPLPARASAANVSCGSSSPVISALP